MSKDCEKYFTWKLDGMSNLAIAEKRLNEMESFSLEYKKSTTYLGFQCRNRIKWSAVAVKRILTNGLYTGTMVGKTGESQL